MAAEDSSNAIDVDTSLDSDSKPNDVTNHDSSKALVIPSPAVCLVRFAGDAASGAVMGSIFGYGDYFSLSSKKFPNYLRCSSSRVRFI